MADEILSEADFDWPAHYLLDSISEAQYFARQWPYNHEQTNTAIGGITPK